jgi:hypothetical protein
MGVIKRFLIPDMPWLRSAEAIVRIVPGKGIVHCVYGGVHQAPLTRR